MSKPLAESLLAFLADKDQAAAIYGDLVELSAIRGHLWFWIAYVRIVAQFIWRPPAGFVLGYIVYYVANYSRWRLFASPRSHWSWAVQHWLAPTWSPVPVSVDRVIFPVAGPLLSAVAIPLWFALPYAAVRYGFRDRFVQLACAAFLGSTLVALDPPVLAPIFAIAVLAGITASLLAPAWRKPVIVLIATVSAGIAALLSLFDGLAISLLYLREQWPHSQFVWSLVLPWHIVSLLALFVPAFVCSRLHRWLLEGRRSTGCAVLAEDADA